MYHHANESGPLWSRSWPPQGSTRPYPGPRLRAAGRHAVRHPALAPLAELVTRAVASPYPSPLSPSPCAMPALTPRSPSVAPAPRHCLPPSPPHRLPRPLSCSRPSRPLTSTTTPSRSTSSAARSSAPHAPAPFPVTQITQLPQMRSCRRTVTVLRPVPSVCPPAATADLGCGSVALNRSPRRRVCGAGGRRTGGGASRWQSERSIDRIGHRMSRAR